MDRFRLAQNHTGEYQTGVVQLGLCIACRKATEYMIAECQSCGLAAAFPSGIANTYPHTTTNGRPMAPSRELPA